MPEYMEISFLAKSVFGDALKSRLPRIAFLAFFPKTSNLAFLPKIEARFWHFPTLILLEKKGGIYEEKELQRSKGFKTSSCKV